MPLVQRSTSADPGYQGAAIVSLSDSVELPNWSRALQVGVAGDVKVTMQDGQAVVFKALSIGIHRIAAKLVWSTGTTATDIVALW